MTPADCNALRQIAAYPGELSDRRLCYGKICVAEPVQWDGESPPTRWVERLRAAGLIAPARVRRMKHATKRKGGEPRWWRESGQALDVMAALVKAGDLGAMVCDLAGSPDASGALEETLAHLYRGGLASPPAALWLTKRGKAVVASGNCSKMLSGSGVNG